MVIALMVINIIVLLAFATVIGYTIGKDKIVIAQKISKEQQERLDKLEKERQAIIDQSNKELQELQNYGGEF